MCDSCTEDFAQRVRIFNRAEGHRWSIRYTYIRNYFAAKWVGWLGWVLDIFTAVIGAVLIYILTRDGGHSVVLSGISITPTDLAVVILFGSLISSFYGPKLRSRKYYNAGQEHQELYDDFCDFIELEVANKEKSIKELEKRLKQLNKRRHDLNQATPQLGGIWYYSMKLWSWFESKAGNIYRLFAPWKKTPEKLYQALHPKRKVNNEEESENPEALLRAKMKNSS